MPTTIEATEAFLEAGALFGPGKRGFNAGVATSGLEMAQSSLNVYTGLLKRVDRQLIASCSDIHANCKNVRFSRRPSKH